jgi:hypothetical protein
MEPCNELEIYTLDEILQCGFFLVPMPVLRPTNDPPSSPRLSHRGENRTSLASSDPRSQLAGPLRANRKYRAH